MQVFDYDWGLQDDFMGSAKIDLTHLELGRAEDVQLKLKDANQSDRYMGEILINLTLWPRSQEDKEIVSITLATILVFYFIVKGMILLYLHEAFST